MNDAASPDAVVLRSLDRRGVATLTLNRPDKGKGDHRHFKGAESSYAFTTVEQYE